MAAKGSEKFKDLCEAIKNLEYDEPVKAELLEQLTKWPITHGFRLQKTNKETVRLLLEAFVIDDNTVSKQVNQVLSDCLCFEEQSGESTQDGDIFDTEGLEFIRDQLMPSLLEKLERTRSKDVLSYWCTVVKILGSHLHTGNLLINRVMKVVEKGFKIPETMGEAFRSWTVLMDNFSRDPKILTSKKRVTLLLMPLVQRNVTKESDVKIKLEVWWHFICLLKPNIHHYVEDVILPFLRFCYGLNNNASKQDTTNPKSPATPLSPAKQHSALEKLCLDALVQLVSVRPLDPVLPRPLLAPLTLSAPALLPLQVSCHAEELLFFVLEAMRHLKPANRSEVIKVEAVWSGLSSLLAQVAPDSNMTGYHHFYGAVRVCCLQHRRIERLVPLLVNILNSAAKLPLKILTNSSILSNDNKPYLMLLDLLLYSDFLEGCHKNNDNNTHDIYLQTLSRLIEASLYPGNTVQSLGVILDKCELSLSHLSQSGLSMMNTVWQSIATSASSLERLTDTSSGAVTSFNTALSLLRFPAQFLHSRGGEERTLTSWEKLYRVVLEQGEISVHHNTGYIVGEVGDRLENILKNRKTVGQLLMNAKVVKIMVDNVDWASLTRSLKTGTGGHHPLAGFERMMNPLGNVTSLISHLRHLTEVLAGKQREAQDTEVAKHLLKSYQKLFSTNHIELIRPLLKALSPGFLKFLHEEFIVSLAKQDSTILKTIETAYTAVCTLIKVKYNKDYTLDFLEEIEEFLVASLRSSRTSVSKAANEMWKVTFSSIPKEKLPTRLVTVLKSSDSAGVRAEVSSGSEEVSSFPSSDGSLSQQVRAEPGILVGLRRQDSDKMVTPDKPSSEASKQPRKRKSLCLRLDDEDSAMFVPIKTTPKGKRVLTDHQRDVLTSRHDDIPALYSELSRDDSVVMLPSQFSSQDSLDESKQGQAEDSNSQSLLKSIKARKNQRFEIPDQSRSLRKGRSNKKSDELSDTETNISQRDIFSEGSNEEFKKPTDNPIIDPAVNDADVNNESETSMTSHSSVNDSQSSVDDVIESSQDATMSSVVTPRRSRRKTLEKDCALPAATEPSSESVDDKKNKWGETALYVAVKKGDVEKIKDLLSQGAKPDVCNFSGSYPLHEAAISAKKEALDIIKILVEAGCDVDITSSSGSTPLHDAILFGSKDQVRGLLKAGASVDLAKKDGKTVMDLVDESNTEGMIEVLREEREEYVISCERQRQELHEKNAQASGPEEEKEQVDKATDVDLDTNDLENKSDEMQCDLAPQATNCDPDINMTPEAEKLHDVPDGKDAASTPDCNKENVNSGDSSETESTERSAKAKEVTKPKSPFTSVNPKQKKALTPGSRGAMLLNLSRRASQDTRDAEAAPGRSPVPATLTASSHASVAGSPLRPWVKYAPSPSHASPSAGILKSKRTADDLDSSNDGSPVSAKRLRLDIGSDGPAPRRVHFNDNPVSESVEIPRTPKQQYTRKKLQMAALADPEDKEEEIEGVTSLVMYPDLVDNKDNISSVLHNLAPGQWAKILEQDFKQNSITTIGQLANLDAKTVGQLRGVKPPKQQTVKLALAAYHNKIKKEENTFRKGTPVQEETSQEEEERIKEEFFSRPSPSPTDMAVDLDTASEAKEKQTSINTETGPEDSAVEKEEEHSSVPEEKLVTSLSTSREENKTSEEVEEETVSQETPGENETMCRTTEQGNIILAEESPEDNNLTPQEGTIKFIPETESLIPEGGETSEASTGLQSCNEVASELVKPPMVDDASEMETNESCNGTEADDEGAAKTTDDKKEEEEEAAQEQSSDLNEKEERKNDLDLTNIMAVMSDSELDLSSLPTGTLVEMYERFSFHQREVNQFRENLSKIIFGRIKQ